MNFMRQFFTVALLVISISSLDAMAHKILRRSVPCPRCSDILKVTWATDGSNCFVFKNPCMLLTANCGRNIEGKPLLMKIDRKRCQELCSQQICLAVYKPLCATCNGVRRTFGNECELRTHMCETGEICDINRADAGCESEAK